MKLKTSSLFDCKCDALPELSQATPFFPWLMEELWLDDIPLSPARDVTSTLFYFFTHKLEFMFTLKTL